MLGILGGGQLDRMFTMAALGVGYRVHRIGPGPGQPGRRVWRCISVSKYDDPGALQMLVDTCRSHC